MKKVLLVCIFASALNVFLAFLDANFFAMVGWFCSMGFAFARLLKEAKP